ncbi:hypothetical protein D3C87_1567920 [compost metagenome]
MLRDAVTNEELNLTKSGHLRKAQVADWLHRQAPDQIPPVYQDALNKSREMTGEEAMWDMPDADFEEIGSAWFEAHKDEILAEIPGFGQGTPAMTLIEKGYEYWWGGLNAELEYRGNITKVAAWFKANGGGPLSEAMARIIAPEWVKEEGGGGYRSRKQVTMPEYS